MEPPKPNRREVVLQNAPNASPADYDEYERLLAKRHSKDPSAPQPFGAAPDPDEVRLKELIKKLFGSN
jgi:hypothetical protein